MEHAPQAPAHDGSDQASPKPGTQEAHDAPEQLDELIGHIEHITFTNEENGWTVAKVRAKGFRKPVSVVGAFVQPTPGQLVRLRGQWQTDPRWGEQFRIHSAEAALPDTAEGLKLYLASGLIHGVGPKYAALIVEHFGDRALDVLEHHPEKLLQVEGIGRKRLARIKESWEEHRDVRDIMLFLQSHGVGAGYAQRIHRHYGAAALTVVRENPYRIAMDVPGFGFLTADKIAAKLGFSKESDYRAEAGAHYVLAAMTDEGHCFVPRRLLVERAGADLDIPHDILEQAVDRLAAEVRVVIEDLPGHGQSVYPVGLHMAETRAAQGLIRLLNSPSSVRPIKAGKALDWVEAQMRLTLADKQRQAVEAAADSKIMVLTGGPGTGKTTIIRAILTIFEAVRAKILLAAPTGRAAKRMGEATGREAMTIHRLLEYAPGTGFGRGEDLPLACDVLVVDEASMLDITLFHHLVKALPLGARLILVGDVNQLPSVGPGNVLSDIIASDAVPVVELSEIFRQASHSAIVVNAHAINKGLVPRAEPPESGELTDFYFVEKTRAEEALAMILELVAARIPARFGLDPLREVQVLTPMHKGLLGASNLNIELQARLNPEGPSFERGGRRFRLGDKVMQVKNNYDKDVYNGDIGRITRLDLEAREAVVRFDGLDVGYELPEFDELVPAYAVSVHKSQGSEYPAVVMPVTAKHYVMLQRNLLYTGVTRGRKLVVLVGERRALQIAVNNDSRQERRSFLAGRLL